MVNVLNRVELMDIKLDLGNVLELFAEEVVKQNHETVIKEYVQSMVNGVHLENVRKHVDRIHINFDLVDVMVFYAPVKLTHNNDSVL